MAMKKIALLIITLGLFCCACSKYCTCSITSDNNNTNNQNIQELEVAYSDNCSDFSNNNRSCK